MTEDDLYDLLSSQADGRVYPYVVPLGSEEVIDRAPEKSGKLKKNVVVVTQKSRRRGEISSGVHIRGVNP
ncbi:hypothetical protein INR21_29520, partial [Klebsiella pneumoniae]|nr:hypothetical protein [Klebsiella pneumoniae]